MKVLTILIFVFSINFILAQNEITDGVFIQEFQDIIDSNDVDGSILFYSLERDSYYSNDFNRASKGFLPASTFKITNSIIALESGIIENDSSIFKWDGEDRRLDVWEQDLTLLQAFHYSCVPCYQEIARKIGAERMNEYLKKFDYGNMVVDSTNIDRFWLEGESRISQLQQINFMKKLYNKELPISDRTEKLIKDILLISIDAEKEYVLYGKTGWSIRDGNNTGWFVGYIETKDDVYFFATNISPHEDFNMKLFPKIRKDITLKAFDLFLD